VNATPEEVRLVLERADAFFAKLRATGWRDYRVQFFCKDGEPAVYEVLARNLESALRMAYSDFDATKRPAPHRVRIGPADGSWVADNPL
jgi:hypothetical protein